MGANRSNPVGRQIYVKIILFICLSLILCACTFHEQYPPDWAPLMKPSRDCWTITGMYNDDSSKKQHPLSYVLTGTRVKSPDLNKSNYVQINKGDNNNKQGQVLKYKYFGKRGTKGLFKNVQMQGARVSWSEAYFYVGRSDASRAQRSRWTFFNGRVIS